MNNGPLEDDLKRALSVWIGALFGAVVSMVVWLGAVLLTDVRGSGAVLVVVAVGGALAGGVLGWRFPRVMKAIGSAFLSLLP